MIHLQKCVLISVACVCECVCRVDRHDTIARCFYECIANYFDWFALPMMIIAIEASFWIFVPHVRHVINEYLRALEDHSHTFLVGDDVD